jgi:alkylation response protein AidB-like acyl-CoA dehydrogenase
MDFSLNEVQEMLADSIDKFIANEYAFEIRQTYAASKAGYSADVWGKMAELGWTAVPFSEDDGGFAGDQRDIMVMMQRLGRGLVVEPFLANILLAGGILKRVGNAQQKQQWLQAIIGGELHATLAFTEPQRVRAKRRHLRSHNRARTDRRPTKRCKRSHAICGAD